MGEEDFVSRLQDATVDTEHFESDLSLDDLPALIAFEVAAQPQVDVQVTVQTSRPARVRVTVQVEGLSEFQQLSLF